jgi:hypothetical protein
MTQRERQIPEGGAPQLAAGGPLRPCDAPPTAPAASVWEEWFARATPQQQQDALALAVRQGLLYAGQLPAVPPEHTAAVRATLPALLNGKIQGLEPTRPAAVAVEDNNLDTQQREAVARALATPDVALIQGYPGTGKSRVLAEIVRQAARRGERVLLLAPGVAALDRVLERIGNHEAIFAVRCLAAGETAEALPPCIRRLAFPERLRSFCEQTLPAARRDRDEAQAALGRLREQRPIWERLADLAERYERLAGCLRVLAERRDGVAADVAADLEQAGVAVAPTRFQAEWAVRVRRRDEARARLEGEAAQLRADAEKLRAEEKKLEAEVAPLRPLVGALRRKHWWTPRWWYAVFRRKMLARVEELERAHEERRTAAAKKEQELADLAATAAREDEQLAKEGRLLAEAEAARRRSEIDAEAAALTAEQRVALDQWRAACEALGDTVAVEPSQAVVHAGRERVGELLAQEERRAACAQGWAEAIEAATVALPEHLARWANVVATTTAALAADPQFGERAPLTFDLLLLDEAHRVTESEFQALARRARRWVLVGEPAALEDGGGARPAARSALRPGFFHRLWQPLHADPRRLPYAWSRHGDRLVCVLRSVSTEQQAWLESEPVADQPDVELRILTPPPSARCEPQVAEVRFPAATPLEAAKTFIYRELQELAVQPAGPTLHWSEAGGKIVLTFGPAPQGVVAVPLEEGIREWADLASGRTWSLEFDSTIWTRLRAEAWVIERLGLRDLGRTALLTAVHRADPALTGFVSELFFAGICEAAPGAAGAGGVPVEFVAVPSLAGCRDAGQGRAAFGDSPAALAAFAEGTGSHRSGVAVKAPRLRAIKGGAGLELDLADNKPLEHVPAELRAALPRQGLVNYFEARAVVQSLEGLFADPAFRDAAARWQTDRAAPCSQGGHSCGPDGIAVGHCPAVAVMALYPAQAELLRLLLRRSPALANLPWAVEVGLPSAFRQRECLAALVSLTRSHSHRAVSYGDGPHGLAEACTRAAGRLILVGDPATLARRSQWQGALDHLDEAAARTERSLAARLVACIQGHGPQARALRLREGGV